MSKLLKLFTLCSINQNNLRLRVADIRYPHQDPKIIIKPLLHRVVSSPNQPRLQNRQVLFPVKPLHLTGIVVLNLQGQDRKTVVVRRQRDMCSAALPPALCEAAHVVLKIANEAKMFWPYTLMIPSLRNSGLHCSRCPLEYDDSLS